MMGEDGAHGDRNYKRNVQVSPGSRNPETNIPSQGVDLREANKSCSESVIKFGQESPLRFSSLAAQMNNIFASGVSEIMESFSL